MFLIKLKCLATSSVYSQLPLNGKGSEVREMISMVWGFPGLGFLICLGMSDSWQDLFTQHSMAKRFPALNLFT